LDVDEYRITGLGEKCKRKVVSLLVNFVLWEKWWEAGRKMHEKRLDSAAERRV
jgi:hypothetical protein